MDNKAVPVNITINKSYDSEFCGSIPLHLVNMVQPHGMLLVVDKQQLQVIQASENISQVLNKPLENILDLPLADLIPADQHKELLEKLSQLESFERIPVTLSFTTETGQRHYTALVHVKEEYVLVELEEIADSSTEFSFIRLYQQTKYINSLLKQAADTAETTQIAADEIKKLSGFDRVLVYQFDPQWNGIVLAQANEDGMDDFMGLRFPASDVPKQARDLYFRNPYRLIPICKYEPVRMLPVINPLTHRFTDLSDCNLRSVASVHLEYLANMKVMASMSLPIIIDNKLWGLIACHHRTEKNPGYELRSSLELLSDIVATQIAAKEREHAISVKAKLSKVHASLLEQLYKNTSFGESLLGTAPGINELLRLSGAAILYDNNVWTDGVTPTQQETRELVAWLRRHNIDKVFVTDVLSQHYARSQDFAAVASGLVAIPINAEQEEYILGFRSEVVQALKWSGNPDNAIQMEPDGKNYHPRHSFETYMQTVKNTSLPWTPEEVEAAENLRSAVLERIIKERS